MPQETSILGLPGYDIQKMEGRGRTSFRPVMTGLHDVRIAKGIG